MLKPFYTGFPQSFSACPVSKCWVFWGFLRANNDRDHTHTNNICQTPTPAHTRAHTRTHTHTHEEEKAYTSTAERKSFGKLDWPQRVISRPVVDSKILPNQGNHIYHRNLSFWVVYGFFFPAHTHTPTHKQHARTHTLGERLRGIKGQDEEGQQD